LSCWKVRRVDKRRSSCQYFFMVSNYSPVRVDKSLPRGLRGIHGEPLLIIGDTQYNLFGAAHSGLDWKGMILRRKRQGFNLIRARIAPSPEHPNTPRSDWMTSDSFLWGGTRENPDFSKLNSNYLNTVEDVFCFCEEQEMGLELIFWAWLTESPWNDSLRFSRNDWEMMIREVMGRLGRYASLWMVTPANEYNLFAPQRDHKDNEDFLWETAGIIRKYDPGSHLITVHPTAAEKLNPPLKERFTHDSPIDVLNMQTWGDLSSQEGIDNCKGLGKELKRSVLGTDRIPILGEYGYEDLPLSVVGINQDFHLNPSHTRRGALKALFCGCHMIAGFHTSWGPLFTVVHEPEGINFFSVLRDIISNKIDFTQFSYSPELLHGGGFPFCLAAAGEIAAYSPAGRELVFNQSDNFKNAHVMVLDAASGKEKGFSIANCHGKTAVKAEDGSGEDWIILIKEGK
jgi:hypothetical protein